MPALQFDRFSECTRGVVWYSSETTAELQEALPPPWRERLPTHLARIRETLGARRALLALEPDLAHRNFEKDEFGKPFLKGSPPLHFSISHSHGHAAALVSDTDCGVDLQLRVEKILRLRSKFERDDERIYVSSHPDEVAALHVLWGAKESLFKLWGQRNIDWHQHLIVHPFDLRNDLGAGSFLGEVRKDGHNITAQLYWRWIGNFCLVAAERQVAA